MGRGPFHFRMNFRRRAAEHHFSGFFLGRTRRCPPRDSQRNPTAVCRAKAARNRSGLPVVNGQGHSGAMAMISTADAATAAEAPTELGVSHAELESQRNAAAAATGQIAGRHSRITGGMGDRNLAGVRSNDGDRNLVPQRMFKCLSGSHLVRLRVDPFMPG